MNGKFQLPILVAMPFVLFCLLDARQGAYAQEPAGVEAASSTNVLWYRQAAEKWEQALPLGKPGEIQPTLAKAIEKAKRMADRKDLILVTGSLFTVGEAMAILDPEKYKPDSLR